MRKLKDGRFTITLGLEKDQAYQFRYWVNEDEWHNDGDADGYAPHPFGGDNSVVVT